MKSGRMKKLHEICASGQAQKIDGFLVDITSAYLLVKCHEQAKKDRTREIIETQPLDKVISIAWRANRAGLTK